MLAWQNALRKQQDALTQQWEGERAKLAAIQARAIRAAAFRRRVSDASVLYPQQTLKEEVDAVSKDVERAERSYDLNRAAELKCVCSAPFISAHV